MSKIRKVKTLAPLQSADSHRVSCSECEFPVSVSAASHCPSDWRLAGASPTNNNYPSIPSTLHTYSLPILQLLCLENMAKAFFKMSLSASFFSNCFRNALISASSGVARPFPAKALSPSAQNLLLQDVIPKPFSEGFFLKSIHGETISQNILDFNR